MQLQLIQVHIHMALDAVGVGMVISQFQIYFCMCGYSILAVMIAVLCNDVDEKTFLIDPKIFKKITKRTKAIMVVHLYGLMCDMQSIMRIAKK